MIRCLVVAGHAPPLGAMIGDDNLSPLKMHVTGKFREAGSISPSLFDLLVTSVLCYFIYAA
jgi:hypothetical protein